jgi:carboxyl-terminal processing protease
VINKFSLEYANENRDELTDTYKDATAFKDEFEVDKAFMDEFFAYTSKEHEDIEFSEEDYKLSQDLLHLRLKAMVAQNIWDYQAFYQIFNRKNEIFMEAYNALKNGRYEKMNLNIK